MQIARDAVNSCHWPLYEVVDGNYKVTYTPKEKMPAADFMKQLTKFRHLFQPGNEALVEGLQAEIDRRWEKLQKLAAMEC